MIDLTSNQSKSEMTISNNGTIEAKVKSDRVSPNDLIMLLRQVPVNCDVTSVYILTDYNGDRYTTVTIKYAGTRDTTPAPEALVRTPEVGPTFGTPYDAYRDQNERNPLDKTMRVKEIPV